MQYQYKKCPGLYFLYLAISHKGVLSEFDYFFKKKNNIIKRRVDIMKYEGNVKVTVITNGEEKPI